MNKRNSYPALLIVLYNPSHEDLQNIINMSNNYKGIVVDNSSLPNFQNENINNFEYISFGKNYGIGFAQEYGIKCLIRKKEISHIFFLDQDTRVDAHYINLMLSEYERISNSNIKLALLGPKVVNFDTNQEYYSKHESNKDSISDFVYRKNIISSGSCISCSILKVVGYPNSALFIDYVDSEWCWRINKIGYVCGQTKKISITHRIGEKTINLGVMQDIISKPFRYYFQYRNYLWLLKVKYVPKKWKIKNGIRLCLRLFYLPFFTTSYRGCYKNMFKGIKDGITKKGIN